MRVLVKVALALYALVGSAHAATVRGTVTLPPEPRVDTGGHWRVENGILPVVPRPLDLKNELTVILEGGGTVKEIAEPPPITIELKGLKAEPRLVVAPPGTVVSFRNDDRVPHTLYADGAQSVLGPETTMSGQLRTQKFTAVGDYHIRDQEFPHIETIVLITRSQHIATVDEKGTFKMEAPEGKYTLRVFWRGAWVVSQPLDVGPRTTEVAIQVPPTRAGTRARGD